MRELLAGLVPGLPAAAVTGIVARADGIPLYAVETVRMLVAEGRLTIVDGNRSVT
jgi:signal transduction protein with GAF and PtsI domain